MEKGDTEIGDCKMGRLKEQSLMRDPSIEPGAEEPPPGCKEAEGLQGLWEQGIGLRDECMKGA